jgi:hypothetical protein
MNVLPDTTVLPMIRAIRIAVRIRWRRPTVIPGPVIANVLRGALGITLRQLVCPREWMDHPCPPCPLYAECAYGQVFQPTPPDEATQLRKQQDLPRPFVIEPPGLDPEEPVTPEGLTFRVMLFGRAIERLPYVISTLDRLGHDGMGRDRVPFAIEQITASHPQGDEVLFRYGEANIALPQRVITTADWLRARLGHESQPTTQSSLTFNPPPSTLHLHFLTPMLLKSGSGIDERGRHVPATEIRERPPFGVIVRRLRDRLSALCAFFTEPWRHPDFAGLGTMADTVRLVDSRTVWLTRDRRSTRTGDKQEISGFVGRATYEFPAPTTSATLAPLLTLGELLHIGKHAPWGNGGVRVELTQGTQP